MMGAGMQEVVIAGIGQFPVGEHWDIPLRSLAARAILAAIKDSGGLKPQALYIGNMLAPAVSHQANLGALLVGNTGLGGIEAFSVEAAGASGAGAFRTACLAVASGFVDVAVAVGVEKVTDMVGPNLEAAIAQMLDADYEALNGLTPTAQAALLMQRYLADYSAPRQAFSALPLLAHAHAAGNSNAMYRKAISQEAYDRAEMVCDPLNLFDSAPYADGAAAVVVTRADRLPKDLPHPAVRVLGSSIAIDTLALHDRPDPLAFSAAGMAVEQALRQANASREDLSFFELCDAYSIYAVLSLEAAGFAQRGEGWQFAQNSALPMVTMGGQKARGNPIGASGLYQIAEAALQLRGQAGACQLDAPRLALIESLGGPASTAIAHVLAAA
jgi:acetyl-CoA C-acetyltransferase